MAEPSRQQRNPPRAILSPDVVRAIRASDMTDKELAELYDVSQCCINQCRNRTTWKHVE